MPRTSHRKSRKSLKKNSKKVHIAHKPHIHISFSVIVLATFLALSILLVLIKPASYNGLQYVESRNKSFHLKVPSIMTQTFSGNDSIAYEHRVDGPGSGLLSHVRVDSELSSIQEIKNKKPIIIKQLVNQEGPYYQSITGDTKKSEVASSIKYGEFKKIPTSFGDGLVSDFSYNSNDELVKGKIAVMFSQDRVYVLSAEAVQDVWDKNVELWDETVNSFGV